MREVLTVFLTVVLGYSLSTSGILPYYISPFFSLSALPVLSLLEPSGLLFTSLFLLGVIHDAILGITPGTTPLFLLIVYPPLRVIQTNFYLQSTPAILITATLLCSVYGLFLMALPGKVPFGYWDFISKIIFTTLWMPAFRLIIQRSSQNGKRAQVL